MPIVALSFAGPIQQPASKCLRSVCSNAVNNGAKEIHILFSSSGGAVDEGFALHNFLRALPVKLTMHCVGVVESIALVVFMAGEHRFCCSDSTFLFHDFAWGLAGVTNLNRLQLLETYNALEAYRIRSQEMLKTRASFTDEDFKTLQLYEKASIYGADFAKEKGIVQEIKQASVPSGIPIHNIEF